jgi:hypothetical protein
MVSPPGTNPVSADESRKGEMRSLTPLHILQQSLQLPEESIIRQCSAWFCGACRRDLPAIARENDGSGYTGGRPVRYEIPQEGTMNTRPILNFPTPKPTWMPRGGKPIRTLLDLLIALAVLTVMAAALFLFL